MGPRRSSSRTTCGAASSRCAGPASDAHWCTSSRTIPRRSRRSCTRAWRSCRCSRAPGPEYGTCSTLPRSSARGNTPMGFWKYAQEDPGYIAIVDPDGTEHAAGDVLARANQVVHALRSLGMERGDAVAAVLPNGSNPMHVYLAALQAGFYYVPINYRLSPAEIAYIITDSEAKVFLSHERFADLAREAAEQTGIPPTHRLAHGTVPGFRSFAEVLDAQPVSLPEDRSTGASMHYTSGTTGQPKGLRRKLNDIDPDTSAELFTGLLLMFGIQPNDGNVHVSTSPNYHT